MNKINLYLIVRFQKPLWFVNEEVAKRFIQNQTHLKFITINSYEGSDNHKEAVANEELCRKAFADEDAATLDLDDDSEELVDFEELDLPLDDLEDK